MDAEIAWILTRFFLQIVINCGRHHVATKRYPCATWPEYFDRLSQAPVHSLMLQGGPMSPQEVAEFERNPNLDDILQVHFLDEAGKEPAM